MLSYMKRGRKFYCDAALLALPILLQNLTTTLLGLVDTFMVGMLGEAPLAAVLVANIPVFVIQLVIFGLQSGSSVLISQFWGKGDMGSINRVIGLGFYMAGAVSAAFAAVMYLLPVPLMSLLTDNQELVPLAAEYARIVGFSYIFNSITGIYVGAHRAMENPKLGTVIFSCSMCANTFLNWVLIFGNLGAPALGVAGAAAATLLSRVLEFVIMAAYAMTNRRFRLDVPALLHPGRALLSKFIHYAAPVVCNETMWGLGTSLYKVVFGHMEGSKEILAARALAGNIEDLCSVAVFAVAGTTAIIIGREIGAGRKDTVYEVGCALNAVAMLCALVIGAALLLCAWFLFPGTLYPVFHLSDTAGRIATMILTFVGATLALRAFNTVNIVGVLRGGGDVRAATLTDIIPMWCVSLPLSAVLALVFRLNIFWVYLGIEVEQLVKFIAGMRRLRSRVWIHDVTQFGAEEG